MILTGAKPKTGEDNEDYLLRAYGICAIPNIHLFAIEHRVRARRAGGLAARPSGTKNICRIYAQRFRGGQLPRRVADEAQTDPPVPLLF